MCDGRMHLYSCFQFHGKGSFFKLIFTKYFINIGFQPSAWKRDSFAMSQKSAGTYFGVYAFLDSQRILDKN
jgi:hypothetical protein